MTYFIFDGSGRIASSGSAVASHAGGWPFDASGNLVVTDGVTAPSVVRGSLPFESTGALAIDYGGTIATYSNGLPFTADGRLSADNTNAVAITVNGIPMSTSGVSIA